MADPNVIAAFKRAARRKAAPPVAEKALYAAGQVESGLRNLDYGDRDSVGALQQRPSQGWKGLRNPEKAADEFLDRAKAYVKAHPGAKSGEVAQAVQRSAFPGRYSAHDVQAAAQKYLTGGGGAAASSSTPGKLSIKGKVTPAHDVADFGTAAAMVLRSGSRKGLPKLGHLGGQSKLAQAQYLLQSGQATKRVPTTSTQSIAATKGTTPAPRDGEGGVGSFHITGPNPKRLQPVLVAFARKVAGEFGEPLTGSDGTGHSRLTTSGNVSQHTTGNATDIPATGTRLLHMGQAALIAAGMPPAQARKAKGGLYNVGSHQIIFLTNIGGNHFNHLHISAR